MSDTERLAFEHAAQLCREYRAENKRLRAVVIVLSVWLVAAWLALLKVLVL